LIVHYLVSAFFMGNSTTDDIARAFSENPQTSTEIVDGNEFYINENPEKGLLDSPILFSNKPSLLNLAKAYFEKEWNEGRNAKEMV
jgi:hypothetical protein